MKLSILHGELSPCPIVCSVPLPLLWETPGQGPGLRQDQRGSQAETDNQAGAAMAARQIRSRSRSRSSSRSRSRSRSRSKGENAVFRRPEDGNLATTWLPAASIMKPGLVLGLQLNTAHCTVHFTMHCSPNSALCSAVHICAVQCSL